MNISDSIPFNKPVQPLAEKDTETVKALMWLFQKAYSGIGIFIIVAGICVLPWLDCFWSAISKLRL